MIITPHFLLGIAMLVVWAIFSRVAYVIMSIWLGSVTAVRDGSSIKTLVVLGSGGHTGEMLRLTKVGAAGLQWVSSLLHSVALVAVENFEESPLRVS